jgi:hypothetical protein
MGKVIELGIRGKKHDYEKCAGCQESFRDNEEYTEVVLPFEEYNQHILLCGSCAAESKRHGIL